MFTERLSTFMDLPVVDFTIGEAITNPTEKAFRLRDYRYEMSLNEILDQFFEAPELQDMRALVIGAWDDAYDTPPDLLLTRFRIQRAKLPQLKGFFLGDMTFEDCEVSWIQQTDVTPFLESYPGLEHFGARGGLGLMIGPLRHISLRSICVQSSGLDGALPRNLAISVLPELEHLELYLGGRQYGWRGSIEDVLPLLESPFPKLKYLGLRNSEIADEIAEAVATSPVMDQIEVLDLSLGTLTDTGARHLLEGGRLGKLQRLDFHHHYVSPELCEEFGKLGIEVNAEHSESEHEYDYGEGVRRYVAVGE